MPGSYNAGSVYAEATLNIDKFKAAAAQMGGESGKIVAALEKAGNGLAQAQSNLDALGASLEAAQSRLSATGNALSSSSTRLRELEESANAAAITAAQLETAYNDAVATFGETSVQAMMASDAYKEAEATANGLQAAVEKQEGVVNKNTSAFKAAEAAVRRYESRIRITQSKIDGFSGTISDLNSALTSGAMQGAAADIDSANAGMELFSDVTEKAGDALKRGFGSALQTAVGRLDTFKNSTGATGLALQAAQRSITPLVGKLSLATTGYIALGAAAVYAAYKLYDFASGAKAAREAQEKLNASAKEWADTDVTTSYEKSKGMSAFGLQGSDFSSMVKSSRGWMEELTRVWSDGKKETDDIVSEMVNGFTSGTDDLRKGLAGIKETAATGGYASDGFLSGLDDDITRLDEIDAAVENLLKKKQNGLLSEDEIANLQSLFDEREAIQIKYQLKPDSANGNAFEQIQTSIDSALSRGAKGTDVWADAYAAATQGLEQYNQAIQQEYDRQYAVIQLMENDGERKQALQSLNDWWNTMAEGGVKSYSEAVAYAMERTDVFGEGGSFDGLDDKLVHIRELIAGMKPGDNTNQAELSTALSELDETQIVELTTALVTMQEAARQSGTELSESAQTAITVLNDLKTVASEDTYKNLFSSDTYESLQSMFGAGLDNEVLQVFAALDAPTLEESYKAWAEGKHADIIPSVQTEGLEGFVTAVYEGQNVTVDLSTLDSLTGTVTVYTDDGVAQTAKLSQLAGFEGTITAYKEGQRLTLDMSTINTVTGTVIAYTDNGEAKIIALSSLGDLTGTVSQIAIGEGVTPPSIDVTARIISYELAQNLYQNDVDSRILFKNFTTADYVQDVQNAIDAYNELNEVLNEDYGGNLDKMFEDYQTPDGDVFTNRLQSVSEALSEFSPDQITKIGDAMQSALTALNSGSLNEEQAANAKAFLEQMQEILTFAQDNNIGEGFVTGISSSMTAYTWAGDAEQIAASMISAIDAALGIASPAKELKPTGENAAAGIGVGLSGYDFSADAAATAANLDSYLRSAFAGAGARNTGENYALGLASGIRNGKSEVINAAIEVANAAIQAAKSALEINSPSKVTESFGEYFDMGFIGGVKNLAPEIARAVEDSVYIEPPHSLGESRSTGGSASPLAIDYDRLAEAMSNFNMELLEDGRVAARIRARHTAEASAQRKKSIALGYGMR